jgi:hypothetical protein
VFQRLLEITQAGAGNAVVPSEVVMASCPSRHVDVVRSLRAGAKNGRRETGGISTMWSFADRVVKAVSDVTVGTVIVLVHVALADRRSRRQTARVPQRLPS